MLAFFLIYKGYYSINSINVEKEALGVALPFLHFRWMGDFIKNSIIRKMCK